MVSSVPALNAEKLYGILNVFQRFQQHGMNFEQNRGSHFSKYLPSAFPDATNEV